MITLQIIIIERNVNGELEVKVIPNYETLNEELMYRDKVDRVKSEIISVIRRGLNEN